MVTVNESLPALRWGIIGTGLISSWFTSDITAPRKSPKANHIIQAIGSSSLEKGKSFVSQHLPTLSPSPTVYPNYQAVYDDPNVDIIYIGTPHALHKQQCLDAIAAGKHVLCEKAFTLNASEARDVLAAAAAKNVFVMEAMWTRFHPLVATLHKVLHEEKAIGDVHRVYCDFGLDIDLASLPSTSRLRDPAMGAGSLLDIGIYALTWGLLTLDPGSAEDKPDIVAAQTLRDGFDIASSFIITYPSTGRQGILTSTMQSRTPETFLRIEGTAGYILVEGPAASLPRSFSVCPKIKLGSPPEEGRKYEFEVEGKGFYFEADAAAESISQGRKENEIMPLAETVRVMEILDEIRRQGGATFPQEEAV
ncbi:Gfo/Idh/MocA family protein [Aspergillus lucknowensis]|uniref:D-xylose 1-dehydrogenase (NADP(+), D-xylono-1,5-lactone-forming) n=1 Tax=Aspergillus lucknowensis TaxID=176173 RepID=A0ABR4L851_9EURO